MEGGWLAGCGRCAACGCFCDEGLFTAVLLVIAFASALVLLSARDVLESRGMRFAFRGVT